MEINDITHTYRNCTITKFDTGGRRMGRMTSYTTTCNGKTIEMTRLAAIKVWIDIQLDSTDADREHADAIAQMLGGE